MSARWHFREFKPGDNVSDPDFAKALFSRDQDDALARSLVREAIQNSLDARLTPDRAVRVRLTLRTGSQGASPGRVKNFLEGAWEHLHGDNAGAQDPPSPTDPVPYLVVEDFETKGLVGADDAWDPFDSTKNAFFLFFRALGKSGKQGEDRGRWGVGKFVFPLASRAHCLFGYTVEAEGQTAKLMGRMVLKTHRAGGTSYHPDGHWGLRGSNGNLVLAERASAQIAAFRATFAIERDRQTGLSVVVPWVPEVVDGPSLSRAAVEEYFLPLLRSELSVEVDDNGKTLLIDSACVQMLAQADPSGMLGAKLSVGVDAATWPQTQLIALARAFDTRDVEWREDVLADDDRQVALARLEAGETLGVRVRVRLRPKGAAEQASHFDMFIRRVEGIGRVRPLIVRQGITISEDKTTYLHDHVALIVVDDEALASFVGDAETPAHTTLQTDLVKDKYTLAGKVLVLLRTSAAELIRYLERSSREDDVLLLSAYFPQVDPEQSHGRGGEQQKKGRARTPDVPPIPQRTKARYRIVRAPTGFAVRRGDADAPRPQTLTVRMAYDVRRGNPFQRFQPLDFSLRGSDLTVSVNGMTEMERSDNRLVVRCDADDFELAVTGFDENRNLIVRVDASQEEEA